MKKYYFAVAVVALLITTIGAASFVSASDENKKREFNKPEINQEQREEMKANMDEMKEIMDNGDYAGWTVKMQEKLATMQERHSDMISKVTDSMTEEKFNQMREVHVLKQAGEFEEAKALAVEYGMDKRFEKEKMGHKKGMGMKGEHKGECPFAQEK